MKTLDLRNLSESERDAAINEAVAVLAGWQHRTATRENPIENGGMRLPNHFSLSPIEAWWKDGDPANTGVYCMPPRFATSCDAVMPLLEKAFRAFQWNAADRSFGYLSREGDMWKWTFGSVPLEQGAFCLAACIALLRANGVEVLL